MMTRRRRAPLLVVGLLVVLVAAAGAAGMSLALRPAALGAALDPRIPNGQILIARGLSGVATLGPLPPTARAAVLRFPNGETVRVPLSLGVLRRVRAYAGPLVSRAGLQLHVAAARDTSLVLGFVPFGDARGATLTDMRGHVVPLQNEGSECGGDGFVDTGLSCRQVWAYPPQQRGARLTLTIRSFAATPNGAVANAVGAGPWRLPVAIP